MYKVTIQTLTGDEKNLYYPGNSDYCLTSGVLKLKIGSAGECNLVMPLTNPVYDEVVRNSIITVYEDGEEIWRGDIRDTKKRFDKSIEIYALEDLAWLGEEPVSMTEIMNQTRSQRFTQALATYNAMQNEFPKRQFTQGMLTIEPSTIIKWRPEYEKANHLDCFRTFLAGSEGYLRVRRVTNNGVVTRYLDIVHLEEYGVQADQTISFGQNLLDFVKDIDTTNFLNVLYPYGAETDETLYGDTMRRIAGNVIQNNESVAGFGRRARIVTFDTESVSTLNRLAEAYLTRYSQPKMKLEAKAIDLGNIEEIGRFHLGDSVRVVAHSFGVDQRDYITKQDLDLLNIANNKIELSNVVQNNTSLTSQVASMAEVVESEPSESSILNAAKKNTMSILDGSNGGNIYFKFNSAGQIIEQGFTNNADLEQATAISRWNINGKAILTRQYPSDPWTVKVAETIDGGIVADFIKTGTMSADRIRGGTLELGGLNNTYGTMLVKDASGEVIGRWDNKGINIYGGTIISRSNISWAEMVDGEIRGGRGDLYQNPTYIYFDELVNNTPGWLGIRADGLFLKVGKISVTTGKNDSHGLTGTEGSVITEYDLDYDSGYVCDISFDRRDVVTYAEASFGRYLMVADSLDIWNNGNNWSYDSETALAEYTVNNNSVISGAQWTNRRAYNGYSKTTRDVRHGIVI